MSGCMKVCMREGVYEMVRESVYERVYQSVYERVYVYESVYVYERVGDLHCAPPSLWSRFRP